MTVTDLLGKDAGLTVLTVLHSPGGSSNCHAVQLTERATGGQAAALSLTSYNSSAGALQIRAAGPYLQAYNDANELKFELANSGALTLGSSLTTASVTTTGAVSVGTTLAVTGASTLTGNTTVGGTLGVTGASTLASAAVTGNATVGGTLGVTGATTMTTASTSGAATLNSAVITTSATVGTTLAVSGTSLFTGAVTVDDANFSILGTNKGYRFRPLGARLDCEATGSDWMFSVFSGTNFDGTQRTYLRLESGARIAHACGTWTFTDTADSAAVHTLDGTNNTLGFHGAAAVAKQTVTGAKGGNAALTDLISKLATLGLITDGTS